MKRIIAFGLCLLFLSTVTAQAFLYEIPILSKEEIKKLSKEDLSEAYIEAKIEEKASQEFHIGAGFSSAKDYTKRKNLLRYIINLRKEMSERQVQVDPINDWLK